MDYEADYRMPFTLMEWIEQIGIFVLGIVMISLIGGIAMTVWEYLQNVYYNICDWFTQRRIAREEREIRERRGW